MIKKTITVENAADAAIKALYQSAFPVEEQIPYNDILRLTEVMSLDFTAYYEGSVFLGFTIVYPRAPFTDLVERKPTVLTVG